MSKSPKKSVSKAAPKTEQEEEEDVYGGLNASLTIIMHGVESDWIEEEMSDDDDFRFEYKLTCFGLETYLIIGKMFWNRK